MKKLPTTSDSKTWKKLMILGQKQGSIRLSDLSVEMGLSEEESLGFIRQVFPLGIGVEVYHQNDECWVDVNAEAIQYMLPLSPSEWMQLHEILQTASEKVTSASLNSLKQKVTENGPIKAVMEILTKLDEWEEEMNLGEQDLVQKLEMFIAEKKLVHMCTKEHKDYTVFPNKVLHLEGELSLIGEDATDHCLLILPMDSISEVTCLPTTSVPEMTEYDVEEFIVGIRTMNDKETRLILKIHDPQAVNLFPHHHFLGKPCMITNSNGDLIWAAYVEPCEALYEWLTTLGKNVEILDPVRFKQEYLTYCEEKLRNVA